MSLFRIRKALALVALATLGLLIVTAEARSPDGSYHRSTVVFWTLLVPLAVTAIAFLRQRSWSRWLALAAGIAVLPWGAAFLWGPKYGAAAPTVRALLAVVASLLLIVSVSGSAMVKHYEGRAKEVDWLDRRMALVSWAIACNLAAILALYVFVFAYRASTVGVAIIPALLLIGLVAGVLLLGRQKTSGLLLVGGCCLAFVPAGGYFVWREAQYAGEAILFAAVFAPGVVTGWACLLVFGKPMWRHLTSG